jgi:hypothetical protein
MSHSFPGIDPFTTTAALPGYGAWTDAEPVDDGDDRDAAGANNSGEAAINRTNYLRWRYINQLEGGAYTSTQPISIANPWTTTGRFVRVGPLAWEGTRVQTIGGNGSGNVTMTDADMFIVTAATDGATHVFTFVPPTPSGVVPARYRFSVRLYSDAINPPSNNGTIKFNNYATGGTPFYLFQFPNGAGGISYVAPGVDLEYIAATGKLIVIGICDPNFTPGTSSPHLKFNFT